jgi:hypothetical protein
MLNLTHYEGANSILKDLQKCKFEFFLTGSRYFGYPCSNSDWDLYAESSFELREKLEHMGFNSKCSLYLDDLTECAYECGSIHIQLIKTEFIHTKHAIQKVLAEHPFFFGLNKNLRTNIWEICAKLGKILEENK